MTSLIESGMDIINPVQTNCHDMDAARLKSEFGRDIVFWGGGVDPREILTRGTPQQVGDDVRRRMDIFAPGGGYVFNPGEAGTGKATLIAACGGFKASLSRGHG